MKEKRNRRKIALVAVTAVMAVALGLAGCGSGYSTPATTLPTNPGTLPATGTGQPVTLNLTARGIAFDRGTLTVPAGAAVTLVFDNQDSLPHNFALYTDSSARTRIFSGDIINGPGRITYTFTAPAGPGSYFFRCDVHPTMNGTFVVE